MKHPIVGIAVTALIAATAIAAGAAPSTAQQPPPTPVTADGYALIATSTDSTAINWNGSDNSVAGRSGCR